MIILILAKFTIISGLRLMHKARNIRKLGTLIRVMTMQFAAICLSPVSAQDIHFSQNFSAPFNLNPSLTGDFHGDYRLIGNYRNQWNSVTVPYRTFGIGGDMRSFLGYEPVSVGLTVFNDVTGDAALSTTVFQINASIGYHLTSNEKHFLAFGIQPGLVRQGLDATKFSFDNQYNNQTGLYDSGLSNGEDFSSYNNSWVSMAAGLRYSFEIARRNKLDAGFAVFNLTGPPANKRYLSSTQQTDALHRRVNFHANYQRKIHEKADLIPGVIYSRQGRSEATIFGLSTRYLYNGYTAIHLGYWYREGDAGFATFGVTYRTVYMAISYDVNTSRLREVSDGRGALELTIIYVIHKFKPNDARYLSCPNYL